VVIGTGVAVGAEVDVAIGKDVGVAVGAPGRAAGGAEVGPATGMTGHQFSPGNI